VVFNRCVCGFSFCEFVAGAATGSSLLVFIADDKELSDFSFYIHELTLDFTDYVVDSTTSVWTSEGITNY
jgi:hypothetical protein